MGRVHLDALRRLESVEVAAIAGTNLEVAQQSGRGLWHPHDDHRLPGDPARSGHRCGPHLHAQRAALFHGQRGARSRQARGLRKAAGHHGRRGARTGRPGRAKGPAQLRLPQSALLPHGAADAPHERGRRSGRDPLRAGRVFAGLAALRDGLELAHRLAGRRRIALHGRHWLALVRHGRARHRPARHLAWSPILQTFHATRKQPKHSVETFANKLLGPEDYIERPSIQKTSAL